MYIVESMKGNRLDVGRGRSQSWDDETEQEMNGQLRQKCEDWIGEA